MSMWNLIKAFLLMFCNGVARLICRPSQPAILMYHSFNDAKWKYSVRPVNLEKQIEFLVQHRTIVPLGDVLAWMRSEKDLPNNSVVITIDDGYEDTYSVFFPLAKKYKIPFTLFLTTSLISLEKLGNFPRVTIGQLREMYDSGLMNLGVHGHSHMNFTEVLEHGLEREEIDASRAFMEREFGTKITAVAYPSGRTSDAVFAYVRNAQYEIGCTTRPGFLSKKSDPLRLFRIEVDRMTNFYIFMNRLGPGFPLFLGILRVLRAGRLKRVD